MIDFLQTMWGNGGADLQYGELRVIQPHRDNVDPLTRQSPRVIFVPLWEITDGKAAASVQANIAQWDADGWDVFYGVLPRTRKEGTADATVEDVRVLWVDLDTKLISRTEAWFLLNEIVPAPTVIVDSGNGYHAYWRLATRVPWRTAEAIMRGLAERLGGDRVYDRPRILRVPGTHNHKGLNPLPVRVLKMDNTRYVSVGALSDFRDRGLEIMEPPPAVYTHTFPPGEGWSPSSPGASKFGPGERNHGLISLAGAMVAKGLLFHEVEANLRTENQLRCEPPLPDREVHLIAKSVMRYAR